MSPIQRAAIGYLRRNWIVYALIVAFVLFVELVIDPQRRESLAIYF